MTGQGYPRTTRDRRGKGTENLSPNAGSALSVRKNPAELIHLGANVRTIDYKGIELGEHKRWTGVSRLRISNRCLCVTWSLGRISAAASINYCQWMPVDNRVSELRKLEQELTTGFPIFFICVVIFSPQQLSEQFISAVDSLAGEKNSSSLHGIDVEDALQETRLRRLNLCVRLHRVADRLEKLVPVLGQDGHFHLSKAVNRHVRDDDDVGDCNPFG
jgi:hypothetical protein